MNIDYLLTLQPPTSRGSLDEAPQAHGFPKPAFGNDGTFMLKLLICYWRTGCGLIYDL